MKSDYKHLNVDSDGRVIRVALDRPATLNAVDGDMHAELSRVFRDVANREGDVVVLTGTGDAFSAGGDIDWMADCLADSEQFRTVLHEGEAIVKAILDLRKPLIAKVQGDAMGLGATLALYADVVFMSEDAALGDTHVAVGLAAGDGGAAIWPLLTDIHTAKELMMTGRAVDADEAVELGLVNHAVPPNLLDERVDSFVEELLDGSQPAIRYTKVALNKWIEMGTTLALREGLMLEGLTQHLPDHEAGVRAFRDGESPDFPTGADEHQ